MEKNKIKSTKKIKLNEYHSKEYLEKLRKKESENEEVKFILPNGKEV